MRLLIVAVSATVMLVTGIIWMMTPNYTCSSDTHPRIDGPSSTVSDADYAGWYELTDDHHVLVTWGASGGLRLIDFDQPEFVELTHRSDDTFRLGTTRGTAPRSVEFIRDEAGAVTALRRNGDRSHVAIKDETAGYRQTQVSYRNGDIRLAGTLLIPRSEGPHPGAVVLHGSGLSDRDNLWYWTIVDHLARNGTAVLFPDKRGAGGSEGNWCSADFSDLANDALVGVQLLQRQEIIDSARIGLLGISQGGWVAPIAAHRGPDVAYLIAVSSSTVGPSAQLLHEARHTLQDDYGMPRFAAHLLAPITTQVSMSKNRTWWSRVQDFDPLPFWKDLRIPALVVYGEDDPNVPVEASVHRLERTISASDGRDITVVTYPDSGHGLLDPETGWIRDEFLALLADWMESTIHQSAHWP